MTKKIGTDVFYILLFAAVNVSSFPPLCLYFSFLPCLSPSVCHPGGNAEGQHAMKHTSKISEENHLSPQGTLFRFMKVK